MKLSKKSVPVIPHMTPSGAVVPALLEHKAFSGVLVGAAQSLAERHRAEIEADGFAFNGIQSWVAWTHNESRETQRNLIDKMQKQLPKQIDATVTHGVDADLLAEIRREKEAFQREKHLDVVDVEAVPVIESD